MPTQTSTWAPLVARIRAGEESGMSELYGEFEPIRLYLVRRVGRQEANDKVHDVFVGVVEAIKSGALRDPEALMGYAMTITRRTGYRYITESRLDRVPATDERDDKYDPEDPAQDQEMTVIADQQYQLAMKILDEMPAREREVLVRSLLMEQDAEQICDELGVSAGQLYKIRCNGKHRARKALHAILAGEDISAKIN